MFRRGHIMSISGAALLTMAIVAPTFAVEPRKTQGQPEAAGIGTSTYLAGTGRPMGIDVSHWQGRIRWWKVADAGIDFAIIKATDGVWFVDGRYHQNRTRAERNGIRAAAYHYARPTRARHDARREADFFVRHARLTGQNLIPALDLETSGGLSRRQLRRWTLTWLRRVEQRLGVRPMIYTSPGFWQAALGDTRAVAAAGYDVVWVAHWGTRRPRVPARDWRGHGWTLWQWTARGKVPGIRGNVDRDWYIGDDLRDLTIKRQRAAG